MNALDCSVGQLDTVRLDLPASFKYLNMLGPCLAEMLSRADTIADRESVIYGVQLAVQEVCTNIVEHAYAGLEDRRIAVAATLDSARRRLVLEFHDSGHAFDPAIVAEPDLVEGQVRGYGLLLIRQLVDEVAYEALADGNHWRLVKHW